MFMSMVGSNWLSLSGCVIFFYTLLLLLIIDIMCVASALRILSALCWFEHLILIKIFLIDICFNTADYCMLKSMLGNVPKSVHD